LFQRSTHDGRLNIYASVLMLSLIMPSTQLEARTTSKPYLEFAEKIYRAGENVNCRARGWFTGFGGDTDFSYYGSWITVMPNPVKNDLDKMQTWFEFNEVYHIIKVLRRGKYKIIGQLYHPGLEGLGVDPLEGTVELVSYVGGDIRLTVTRDGKSKSTDFSCEWEIDDMF